ncbi:MAG: ATP-binding protein, partial [Verrucomicrobiota bacterium]
IEERLFREGLFIGEVVQIARSGRRIPLLCRWVLDRETNSILTSFTDITERHALESALAGRAAELARADRSKDEFLAMLAHELRNPLAPLRNATEILQTPDASSGEREQARHIIARQIENMSRMIDDLLDVSRITEGKIELRRQPVALESILTSAATLIRSGCAARHQHLTLSLPALPVYLDADATRLEQVFANLLGNACKYSGDGCNISLSAERSVDQEPPEVIVRVRDDGTGIDPELLPRVFDLFVQATRALDRAHGGLGIGLTLVSRLVKLHGGSVEARSEGLGYGSEFIVHLPILSQEPAPPAPPAIAAPEILCRMLIVDDNTDSARSMSMLQARRGHVTRTAFTGPDTLAVAAEFLPEVVLLDIGLPGMDGFEVARLLRRNPALAGVFLIAMTGYASPEDRLAAVEAGFDAHLVKPLDLHVLRDCLQTRLRGDSSADTAD